jgi:hypothetical protein
VNKAIEDAITTYGESTVLAWINFGIKRLNTRKRRADPEQKQALNRAREAVKVLRELLPPQVDQLKNSVIAELSKKPTG